MSKELSLISGAMKSRNMFEIINIACSKEDFTEPGWLILEQCGEYYSKDPDTNEVSADSLIGRISRKFPKHQELFKTTIEQAIQLSISLPNLRKDIIDTREYTLRGKLVSLIGNNEPFNKLEETYADIVRLHELGLDSKSLENAEYVSYKVDDFSKLLHDAVEEDKIFLHPPKLQEKLGGIPRQYHVVLFGRPDIGKTTVCLNLVAGFLRQGLRVLYFGNEDPIKQTLIRVVQCINGSTKDVVEANWKEELDKAAAIANLQLVESPNGTIRSLERLVSKNKPDVVVVDQLRNLSVRGDTRVLQLENSARQLREIGKKYNLLMLSVNQAGDSAQNKTVLEMGDMDWSNTGIQGACDLIIGVGANQLMVDEGRRFLSFPKNKVTSDSSPLEVRIDTSLARIK